MVLTNIIRMTDTLVGRSVARTRNVSRYTRWEARPHVQAKNTKAVPPSVRIESYLFSVCPLSPHLHSDAVNPWS